MKTYYFVGGPVPGRMDEFRRRLEAAGGPPRGWLVLPHANGDGRALHVVLEDSVVAIHAHLALFAGIYEHGPILEVRAQAAPPRAGA